MRRNTIVIYRRSQRINSLDLMLAACAGTVTWALIKRLEIDVPQWGRDLLEWIREEL